MKKIIFLTAIFTTAAVIGRAQLKIGANPNSINANSILELESGTKGFVPPRLSIGDVSNASPLTTGLLDGTVVYNSNNATVGGTGTGLYIWKVNKWFPIVTSNSAWSLTGNGSTVDGTNFLGTTDNVPLSFKVFAQAAGRIDNTKRNLFLGMLSGNTTTGRSNTFIGDGVGSNNISGFSNVAIGVDALKLNATRWNLVAIGDSTLFNNGVGATGFQEALANVAVGSKALLNNTIGADNTALGDNTLLQNITGDDNLAAGSGVLFHNTSGTGNSAIGVDAMAANLTGNTNTTLGFETLIANTSGYSNIAIGVKALHRNTTRSNLVAIGDSALYNNGAGATISYESTGNTAVGSKTLFKNLTGYSNTAVGAEALYSNYAGYNNTATGLISLYNNSTGTDNTAAGNLSLYSNTDGSFNSAFGSNAMQSNAGGYANTAIGMDALQTNSTGIRNTAVGYAALNLNDIGDFNTAMGYFALTASTGGTNTAVGYKALQTITTGTGNTAIGYQAQSSGVAFTNTTVIGNAAVVNASNTIVLGNSSVGALRCNASLSTLSDARFKTGITENVKGLEFIKLLRPVTYHLDIHQLNRHLGLADSLQDETGMKDREAILESGFIAQEVEAAANKTGYNFNGVYKPQNDKDTYGLSYAQFVVPLVKAVQEQQALIEKQQADLEEMKKILVQQQKQIDLLTGTAKKKN